MKDLAEPMIKTLLKIFVPGFGPLLKAYDAVKWVFNQGKDVAQEIGELINQVGEILQTAAEGGADVVGRITESVVHFMKNSLKTMFTIFVGVLGVNGIKEKLKCLLNKARQAVTDFLKRLMCRIGESIRKNRKKWQEFLNRIKDKLTGKKAGQPEAAGAACSVSFDKVKPCATPPGDQPAKPCNGNCFRPTTLVAGPHNKIPIGKRWPGQWVYTVQRPETERLSGPPTEVNPETWGLLRLSLNKHDGTAVGIVLLRPISWILETNARAGKTINLDLNELGAGGEATVLTIEPCPEIEPFPVDLIHEANSYRLITGLFTHTSGEVYDLRIKGEPEGLGVTAHHPIWSNDRNGWIPAAELEPGESLTGLENEVEVEGIESSEEPESVCNLEVEGDHCYRVGAGGVLVHNVSGGPNPIRRAEGEKAVADLYAQFGISKDQNVAYAEVNVSGYQDELIANSGRDSAAGTVPSPSSRLFDTFETPAGQRRANDSEVKLLEEIAIQIQPDAKKGQCYPLPSGSVRLYSHFTICPSCDGVIAAFESMFPNVLVSYSDGPR